MTLDQLTVEDIKEMSLIEIAFVLLKDRDVKQAVPFQDLLNEMKELTGFSDEELRTKLSQFYTDLNIDGRFLCIGENQWGLRAWYPYDQIEEETTPQVKVKKKKAKKTDDDELDAEEYDELDEEELEFDDLDDYEEDEEEIIEDVADLDDDLDDDDEDDDELEILEDDEFDLDDEDEEDDLEDDLDLDEEEK